MKRLTTDKPSNNTEAMLNYAYAKNGEVYLCYADGEEDIRLVEYLCRAAQEIGCEFATEENILNGDMCLECDCMVSILNVLAIQAAELRERLKKYEDAEEQGLLVRLPCKPGDTVYDISEFVERTPCPEMYELHADYIGIGKSDDGRTVISIDCTDYYMEDFGRIVFTSREAAEKALEDACRKNT